MKLKTIRTVTNQRGERSDYTQMSLLELSRCIVEYDDTEALKELHNNRPLFCYKDGNSLLMTDFLLKVKQSQIAYRWSGYDFAIAENAYDLTLAKFLNIPFKNGNNSESAETEGPDCRYYYDAFYRYTIAKIKTKKPSGAIEEELMAAGFLQRMVMRHFYLSCLDCRHRARKLIRRYRWKLGCYILSVWLPIEMPGRRSEKWLSDNIPDVDPLRPGERDRVQAIVNKLLYRPKIVSLHEIGQQGIDMPAKADSLASVLEEEISAEGLAEVVAQEKSDNIDQQRPAIQLLGKRKLKAMILEIFDKLTFGNCQTAGLARKFGVTKATFSRFAGCQWNKNSNGGIVVPDLWRNTAHILANNPCFVQAAQQFGVWKSVCKVLDADI
jgi:hypothetical protein